MISIDKEIFVRLYEAKYGALREEAIANLPILLALLAADDRINDIRHDAYMLATVKHECNGSWGPIEEIGHGKGRPYGKPDPTTGKVYYGRGYVQLTWAENYKRIGQALGVDLYHQPELACHYDIAYRIMSYGMRQGAFTGIGLNRYIHGSVCDYVNSRRIINGTDRAQKIADYAVALEGMLRESVVGGAT